MGIFLGQIAFVLGTILIALVAVVIVLGVVVRRRSARPRILAHLRAGDLRAALKEACTHVVIPPPPIAPEGIIAARTVIGWDRETLSLLIANDQIRGPVKTIIRELSDTLAEMDSLMSGEPAPGALRLAWKDPAVRAASLREKLSSLVDRLTIDDTEGNGN
jgi:hypothetical protein